MIKVTISLILKLSFLFVLKLCVDVVCGLKIMCYIVIVFMMQRLTLMGLLVQPNTNKLDSSKKSVLNDASTKSSCSTHSPRQK